VAAPALDRQARARYARQLSLAEIGEAGQSRLLAARIALDSDGDPRARATAALYLERSGVSVVSETKANTHDAHVLIEVDPGDPALREAALFLSGALTAVEVIKNVLGAGTPLPKAEIIRLKEPSS
jgi:hypothetical protein